MPSEPVRLEYAKYAEHAGYAEYARALERFPGLACVMEWDGRVGATSPQWRRELDLPEGDAGALHLAELAHPDDRAPILAALGQAQAGEELSGLVHRFRFKEGVYRQLSWSAAPRSDERLIFVSAHPVGQPSLESRYFRALADATSDFVGISTLDGVVLYVNEAGMDLVGHPRERAPGMSIAAFVHPSVGAWFVETALAATMRHGRWQGEVDLLHADGSAIAVSQVSVLLRDDAGRPEVLATIARDLRPQKQLEAALKLAVQEMSTPIIQVWDGVLALPVLGLVDSVRAQQMMQSLLDAIVRHGCRVTILDLTGVRTIDSSTVEHLFRMVSAARLLGSRCAVSGISSVVAQIIAQLGLDFSEVHTFQSLRDALRFAVREVGALGRAR